jgi:site-specific DNA-adenine methylase
MQYMGGKHYLKKKLTKAILAHTVSRSNYWEPFVGGGNMFEEIATHFDRLFVGDIHEDLILLYQEVANGWDPPSEVSREFYEQLRLDKPSAMRGFAGFGLSFGGIWFSKYSKGNPAIGQYFAQAARNSMLRLRPQLSRAEIRCQSYANCTPQMSDVVYCDPPYRNTANYTGTEKFDHGKFWSIAQAWSVSGVHVFVSEYNAPDGWVSIFEQAHAVRINGGTKGSKIEKLFVWKG